MAKKYNEGNIRDIFLQRQIGHVVRVENIAVCQSKYAVIESGLFKKVYIYVSGLFNTPLANDILLAMTNDESFNLYPNDDDECWTLMKNDNPVPETTMSIHQIAESVRAMEKEQSSFREQMKHEMSQLSDKVLEIHSWLFNIDERLFSQVADRDEVRSDEIDRIRQAMCQILPQLQIAGIITENDMQMYIDEIVGPEQCYCRKLPSLFPQEEEEVFDSDEDDSVMSVD